MTMVSIQERSAFRSDGLADPLYSWQVGSEIHVYWQWSMKVLDSKVSHFLKATQACEHPGQAWGGQGARWGFEKQPQLCLACCTPSPSRWLCSHLQADLWSNFIANGIVSKTQGFVIEKYTPLVLHWSDKALKVGLVKSSFTSHWLGWAIQETLGWLLGRTRTRCGWTKNSQYCINFDVTGCKHCEAPDREIQAALQVKGGW